MDSVFHVEKLGKVNIHLILLKLGKTIEIIKYVLIQ